MTAGRIGIVAAAAMAAALASGAAQASGYPPFYGYSDYFGGPAAYFSHETDVQQVTRPDGGVFGFGTRTYYRGGPFWTYQVSRAIRPARYVRKGYRGPRRRPVLSSRG